MVWVGQEVGDWIVRSLLYIILFHIFDGTVIQNYLKRKNTKIINYKKQKNEIKTKTTSFLKAAEKSGLTESTLNRYLNNKTLVKMVNLIFLTKKVRKLLLNVLLLLVTEDFP